MWRKQVQLWILRFVLGITLAGVVFAFLLVRTKLQQSRVESAIASFESNPSQEMADKLVALLNRWVPDGNQGTRILTLLLWPKVTIRPSYPVGKPVSVTVEQPFQLSFGGADVVFTQHAEQCQNHLMLTGKRRRERTVTTAPETFTVHRSPREPGTYYSILNYECILTKPSIWDRVPQRLRSGFGRSHTIYPCRFDVPIEITAVATED